MKLCIMDFDSTLMDGETIDFIAELAGIKDRVATITQEAMEGRLDFFESLTKRVKLLKGISYNKVDESAQTCHICQGLVILQNR